MKFAYDPITKRNFKTFGSISSTGSITTDGDIIASYIIGNIAFASGASQASLPAVGMMDISGNVDATGNITTTGNVKANYLFGNGAFLTLPSTANIDIFGNVSAAGDIATSGNITTTGNVRANYLFGNGAFLTFSTANIDINGNVVAKVVSVDNINVDTIDANVITSQMIYSGFFSGSGSGLVNIPATGLVSGPLYKNIAGSIEGDFANVAGVNATVVNTSSLNVSGATRAASGNVGNVILANGQVNASNLVVSGFSQMNSVHYTAPTNTINILQLGGTQATTSSTNVFGLGRNLASLRLNTSSTGTFEFFAGGTPVANISTTGNLNIAGADATKLVGTAWATGSDRRIKRNIVPANLDTCFDVVKNLDLKRFEWGPEVNVNDRHVLGWIAQEVEEIFPKSVKTAPAYGLPDAKILDADQLFINTYGALKKAIQIIEDLSTKVDSLQNDLAGLQGKKMIGI